MATFEVFRIQFTLAINTVMRSHLFLLFIPFLFSSTNTAIGQIDTVVYHDYYTKAEKAIAERKIEQAKQFYKLTLQHAEYVKHKLKARRKLATAYYLLNKLDSAEIIISPNLAIDPNELTADEVIELSESYYRILRSVAFKKGDQKKARQSVEKAISLLEAKGTGIIKCASYYIDLGITYWNVGDYESALNNYHKTLKLLVGLDPTITEKERVRTYIALGLVYWSKRDLKKAADHYHLAFAIMGRNPAAYSRDYAITYNNLGNLFSESNKYDSAIYYFSKAIASLEEVKSTPYFNLVEGFRAQFLNNLGIAYVKQAKYGQAESVFNQSLYILKTNIDDGLKAKVYLNLGTCYRKQAQWQKSVVNLQNGLSLKKQIYGPLHQEVSKAYNLIGDLYLAKSEYPKSSLYYDSAALSNPKIVVDGISVYANIEEIWFSISGNIECLSKQQLLHENEKKIESLFRDTKSQLTYTYIHTQDEALMEDIQVLFGRFFLAYYELYQKGAKAKQSVK
jgi:tetratricopeptide (TPR) repeat protein